MRRHQLAARPSVGRARTHGLPCVEADVGFADQRRELGELRGLERQRHAIDAQMKQSVSTLVHGQIRPLGQRSESWLLCMVDSIPDTPFRVVTSRTRATR